jgi:hypothetical protein
VTASWRQNRAQGEKKQSQQQKKENSFFHIFFSAVIFNNTQPQAKPNVHEA